MIQIVVEVFKEIKSYTYILLHVNVIHMKCTKLTYGRNSAVQTFYCGDCAE